MINITTEQIIADKEKREQELANMSEVDRRREEDYSFFGDTLKRMPINQKAFLYDLVPFVSNTGSYDIGDLNDKEIKQLNKLIYEATRDGETSGQIRYPEQGGYGDIMTADARAQASEKLAQPDISTEERDAYQEALDSKSDKNFFQQLRDPESQIKTFLGSFDWSLDDNGNVIITDRYDANIGRKVDEDDPKNPGRIKRFARNMNPFTENLPMSVLSGIAGLIGSREGRGARVNINLGKLEDIEKSMVPKMVRGGPVKLMRMKHGY